MESFETDQFSFEFFELYAIYRMKENVHDLNRDLLEEAMGILKEFYHQPFGVVYIRENREEIDLLAVRKLIQTFLPQMVAVANVVTTESTRQIIEFEKTVVDMIPIESFAKTDEAIRWISGIVEEKRRESATDQS